MNENKNPDLNSKCYWDNRFFKEGSWEKNNGRVQTRTFAECFNRVIDIPFTEFSLLDAGCALGDALSLFRRKYSRAKLSGCDFSDIAVQRCKKEYGEVATFFTSSLDNLEGRWDVIYCSNVLEHFSNPLELSEKMLGNCHLLYLMLPYKELDNGKPLSPDFPNDSGHVSSFFKNSFESLIRNGSASRITYFIDDCPGAWGWPFSKKLRYILSTARHMRGLGNIFRFPKQIIFEICGKKS